MSRILQGGFVSKKNSSTVPLLANSAFTGPAEDVTKFVSMTITYTSDVVSAGGGLSMEFSPDGVNWDNKFTGNVIGKISESHVKRVSNKFFRIVYTNGDTPQGSFRLQTLLHTSANLPFINTTGMPQGSNDVIPVRQFTDIDLDFARKHVMGGRAFFFFGFNNSVGTSFEDIHPNGGDINWLEAAETLEFLSTSAADTALGLGLRSLEVHGLSPIGEDQDEIIVMNGTTPVVSALTYSRVNKMHNETVGTYGGSHQGDITCRVSGGGSIQSVMMGQEGAVNSSVQYGSGEAGNGYWSVPLGKVLYITRLEVIPDVGTNKTIDIALYEREGILNVTTPFDPRRVLWGEKSVDMPISKEFKSHIKIKGLTDLWFRGLGSAASAIEVYLDFYLVDADSDGA